MEKKNNILNIKNIVIATLIVVILLLRFCGSKPSPTEPIVKTTITETITYDTIKESVPVYVPQWRDRLLPPDTVWKNQVVDTTAILKDYFATYYYSDTLHLDSLTLVINDSVSKNKINARNLAYTLLYPTKTITITNDRYLNQREFYFGPAISASTTGFEFVGIESIFRSKRNTTFRINAGINETLGVQVGIGFHWKLKLMK